MIRIHEDISRFAGPRGGFFPFLAVRRGKKNPFFLGFFGTRFGLDLVPHKWNPLRIETHRKRTNSNREKSTVFRSPWIRLHSRNRPRALFWGPPSITHYIWRKSLAVFTFPCLRKNANRIIHLLKAPRARGRFWDLSVFSRFGSSRGTRFRVFSVSLFANRFVIHVWCVCYALFVL